MVLNDMDIRDRILTIFFDHIRIYGDPLSSYPVYEEEKEHMTRKKLEDITGWVFNNIELFEFIFHVGEFEKFLSFLGYVLPNDKFHHIDIRAFSYSGTKRFISVVMEISNNEYE